LSTPRLGRARPGLYTLAVFEPTSTRLWKRLTPQERLSAATRFWNEPPQEVVGTALAAIIKARRLRPQVARSLPLEARARALASLLDPGEPLAASLLVALHLGERRPLLGAFLDALGFPHEDGILKEEADRPPRPEADAARRAVLALLPGFSPRTVAVYLNTLWLQDPERWAALEAAAQALPSQAEEGSLASPPTSREGSSSQ
jgi:hypothetical protein